MNDNMLNELESLAERVVEHLGVELIPIEFDNTIQDDSRLVLRPKLKILINSKYHSNYIECAKAITHEYRHLFQIMVASYVNDERAKRWKTEFENPLTSENTNILSSSVEATRYVLQEIELDAFAFTKFYLEKHEGIEVNHPSYQYNCLIKKYIESNKLIL